MRLKRCGDLERRPLVGAWYRAIGLAYWKGRLSTDHTRTFASRFSDGSPANPKFRTLYLGSNHQVVLYELRKLLGNPESPLSNPEGSCAILSLDVRLDGVVDLCDEGQCRIIGTNSQELTGNWANFNGTAPTQELGSALFDVAGVEGLLFPSSLTAGRNLLVFPDKLGPRSSVAFFNEIIQRNERFS